jgi:hypothetical protein
MISKKSWKQEQNKTKMLFASGGQGVKREAGKKREVGKLGKRGE